jgi:hypothetical protein
VRKLLAVALLLGLAALGWMFVRDRTPAPGDVGARGPSAEIDENSERELKRVLREDAK